MFPAKHLGIRYENHDGENDKIMKWVKNISPSCYLIPMVLVKFHNNVQKQLSFYHGMSDTHVLYILTYYLKSLLPA